MWIRVDVSPEKNALLEVKIISKDGTITSIDYDWEAISFTDTEIKLQFEYDNPLEVKNGNKVQIGLYLFPFKDQYGQSIKG